MNLDGGEALPIPEELQSVITMDPEVLGGTPFFKGTRVTLATFLDHVQAGCSLDRFLKGHASVHREQAGAVLEWLGQQSRHSISLEMAS